ncbi:MAG: N-6 DNA methylase [Rickettsiales bacterium]|jgi:predicted helicase|nr:N-6 DNA methylase [Rickettsiales bacterium]
MSQLFTNYISAIEREWKTGEANEHTYRPHLKKLLESLNPDIIAINEPTRGTFGAPDFVIKLKDVAVGYIETKGIGVSRLDNLHGYEKDQLERYRNGFDNLIYTDYFDFIFYKSGIVFKRVRIADFDSKTITPIPEHYDFLENLLRDFYIKKTTTIKSASRLAELMAGKAKLVANVINEALEKDGKSNSSLREQMTVFQEMLIHDITTSEFADVYAQTIAYGMFAARLHDKSLSTFTRVEAASLIPKTNPFLRNLFGYIAGTEIDERIVLVVDNLAEIFSYTDVADIMRDFGRKTKTSDPIIHFYETFLAEYNPALRKSRGVFYTPQPVVDYIVRAVDNILKTDFELPLGLADNSKIIKKTNTQGTNKPIDKEFHRVQVLDPATGTGTFLAETIRFIHKSFENNTGLWTKYVDEHLLPRIHGFELLMASYAMAHLKLDLVLRETGYIQDDAPINEKMFRQDDLFDNKLADIGKNAVIKNSTQRLGVYLTNSLEEADPNTQTLFFAQWLSNEAREANTIKQDTPVMCVIGNPPYSVSSSNNNDYAKHLIKKYKEDLNERNIQPLSDDYIKFIALGQNFIEKNGSGILAFITNNSFLDGVIHRQMRKSLMETFDKIYILNLHGNSNIGETIPDGGKDENVFDIMQGVSINIFIKTLDKKKTLGKVFYNDIYGKRNEKYDFLSKNDLDSTKYKELKPIEPYCFFVDKDLSERNVYDNGFSLTDLFQINTTGIKTHNDSELISFNAFDTKFNQKISYRPFDTRWINYDLDKVVRHRYSVMQHMLKPNIALIATRQFGAKKHFISFITDKLSEISSQPFASYVIFPLYTYFGERPESNLDQRIVNQISKSIGRDADAVEIFDYIYAVLHSPSYREKYREFLKIDFPKIPYPKDVKEFERLAKLGERLRKLHLMEFVPATTCTYPISGDDTVEKVVRDGNRVYINKTQYFDNVPDTAWEFFIGGYQPAQKWLKDRRGRTLSFEDVIHYQKIIAILLETDNIMKEIG